MSVVALAIDALLPALDIIGIHIGLRQVVDNQLLITMIFLGLGVGPLVWGPLSDSMGRKPVVYMGFFIFLIASVICVRAHSLELMLFGRILQGVGLSSPRTISISIIRDRYSGDYMARVMSFVTVVFLLVPIVAPAVGKWILDAYHWQGIFYVQVIFSGLVVLWFWRRQRETLLPANRIPFKGYIFVNGFKEVLSNKATIGYTLISGFIVGSFLVYLSGSQQIFQEQYGLKESFPYIFAGLAIAVGAAIFLNATLVLRLGMKRLVTFALYGFSFVSLLYIIIYPGGNNPPVEVLIGFFALQFFTIGFLFGNLRALAMEPMGHIAGIAAAITGLISTLMAVPISTWIGRFIEHSALPVFIGFFICSLLAIGILLLLTRTPKTETT